MLSHIESIKIKQEGKVGALNYKSNKSNKLHSILKTIRYKGAKVVALTLASLMVVSTPLSAYASSTSGGIGGSGDGSSSSGGSGGNNSYTMYQQGYRFTIVDGTGTAVSKVVDVWDQAPSGDTRYLSAYKTQSVDNINKVKPIAMKDFIPMIQAERDKRNTARLAAGKEAFPAVEYPLTAMSGSNGSPDLNGEDFRLWMLQGVDMNVSFGYTGGDEEGSGYVPKKTVDRTEKNADGSTTTYYSDGSSYTKPAKKGSSGGSTGGSSSSSSKKTKTCAQCGDKYDPTEVSGDHCMACAKYVNQVRNAHLALRNRIDAIGSIDSTMTKAKFDTKMGRISKCKSAYTTANNLIKSYLSSGKIHSGVASSYTKLINSSKSTYEAKEKALRAARITLPPSGGERASIDDGLHGTQLASLDGRQTIGDKQTLGDKVRNLIFNEITVYAASTTAGTTSGTSATEAAKGTKGTEGTTEGADAPPPDDYTGTEVGVINDLLSIKDADGKFVFDMQGLAATSTPFQLMAEKGYTLIVEPLLWEKPWSYSHGSYSQYVAGTPTNIAEWAVSVSGSYNWLTAGAHATLLCKNYPRSFVMDKDYSFDTMDETLSNANVLTVFNSLPGHTLESKTTIPFNQLTGNANINGRELNIARNVGYGCHVYYPKGAGASGQHTYDTDIVERGKAPDPTRFPIETDYGTKSKNIKIEKYYEDLDASTGVFNPVAFFGRDANPHKITIDDEEPVGYVVEDWFTSTKDKVPPVGGDIKKETFNKYKEAYKDGKYTCDEAKSNRVSTITILPEDKEVVLHVLLRQVQPLEVDVVKVYDNIDGTTDSVNVEKDVEIDNHIYYPKTPENGFNYTEGTTSKDVITTEPTSWTDVPKTNHTVEKGITVDESIKTIYVHYQKDPTLVEGITLHENEISHNFSLSDLAPGTGLANVYRMFDRVGSKRACKEVVDYHSCSDEDCSRDGDPIYCNESVGAYYSNANYSYKVMNSVEYVREFVYETREEATEAGGTANETGGFTGTTMLPQLYMTVQRAYNDKVTMYPGNRGEDVSKLKDMGFPSEGYKPANTRYTALTESEGLEWFNTFNTNWVWNSIENPSGYWDCSGGHKYYGDWVQGSTDKDDSIGKANSMYSIVNNTKVRGYLGKAGEGLEIPERKAGNLSMFGKEFNQNKANYVTETGNFEFYPYINMNFETLGTGLANVKITSENLSKVKGVSNVDVGVYKSSGKNPLELSSTQWSTHAKVHTFLDGKSIADKDSVLPGGAMYNLKGSNATDTVPQTWVGVRSYETCIPDELKVALDKADGIRTTSEAKSSGQELNKQTKEVIDNYQIVQWIASGIYNNMNELDKAGDATLISGVGSADKFGGNKLSTDIKYYLREMETGSNRSDIDILEEKFNQVVYRVYSDVNGKVTVTKDGTELVSAQLKATKDISSLLANAEVRLLEDKTKLVSNYVKSIDIGLGSDRNSKSWYNEAFDGVEVVMSEIAFNVGFGNGNDVRSSVLDTKLTGKLTERRDLYNFEEKSLKEKSRTSQFKTSEKSMEAGAKSKAPGYVGSLTGTDIMIPNIDRLLYTKVFYIPNANVTDLN